MRLVCPSCDARYEIPKEAIPQEGRDVQCSSCGQDWFEPGPSEVQNLTAAPMPIAPEDEGRNEDIVSKVDAFMNDDEKAVAAISRVMAEARAIADELTVPVSAPPPALVAYQKAQEPVELPRAELNMSILSVLREEAERESSARREEKERLLQKRREAEAQIQIQSELALSEAAKDSRNVLSAADDAPLPLQASASRRDLLPNIEEINSTLQPGEENQLWCADRDVDYNKSKSRSFKKGFGLSLLALTLAVVAYIKAAAIGAAIPGLEPILTDYTAWVLELRLWLDGLVQQALGNV